MTKRSRRCNFLTHRELKALLCEAKKRNARDYAMILLGYRHGLRASEVCNIKLSDIDLDAGRIVCERRKGSATNWQKMAGDEIESVRIWLQQRGNTDSPFLFVTRQSRVISRSQFFRLFRSLAEAVGIPDEKCHPHTLKHSIATHLANGGVPVQVIQQRLGHECLKNTMVYLSIANPYVDEQCELARQKGAIV